MARPTSGAAEELVGEANVTAQAADGREIHHGCEAVELELQVICDGRPLGSAVGMFIYMYVRNT